MRGDSPKFRPPPLDAAGRFSIERLDPALRFRLLVTSPGSRIRRTGLLDPLEGSVELTLQPAPTDGAFDIRGLPPEVYSIHLFVKGCEANPDAMPF